MEWSQTLSHPRTIIHIDLDCFYVQVELQKKPHLINEPVGVKQKNIVVTCNYTAREFGVKKCMQISEALKVCPKLLLFNGEDLYKYRQASNQIHKFLLSFTGKVEKSGLDENYLDVTELVKESQKKAEGIVGYCIGDVNNPCECGCHERLSLGSQIAEEIRSKLKSSLGYSSCCGISYNKLLAKLCCGANKPNKQTTLLPNGRIEFLKSLDKVDSIPGIGEKMKQKLESIGIRTVKELQDVSLSELVKKFQSEEIAGNLKNLSFGHCDAEVKLSGKPSSIGLEDGCRMISVESEVKHRFKFLLQRLMILVEEDGRMPTTVKVTARKYDKERKGSNKETRQCPIPGSWFGGGLRLSEESANKLLDTVMGLFCKMVDISRPFHVTLLGLAFTKFQEKMSNRSMASFLLKRRDLSVQSLTSFVSEETGPEATEAAVPVRSKSDSDSEVEPSPKKTKLETETCSPSALRVENLTLNGDLPRECPEGVDPTVFQELPKDLQESLIREWKQSAKPAGKCTGKQSLIHAYFVPKTKT